MRQAPIGILDSGIGGLSIAAAIHKMLPQEEIVYFADNANLPYGAKTDDQIKELTRAAVQRLVNKGSKLIVIACNTASTTSIEYVRQAIPQVPIVGVVPMVKPAAAMTNTGVIAVLMTPATLRAGYYHNLKQDYALHVKVVDEACPDWVEMAETDGRNMAEIKDPLERVLAEGADVIALACTHFPILLPEIQAIVKGRAQIIEPGPAIARQVSFLIGKLNLANSTGSAKITYDYSGEPGLLEAMGEKILGVQK